MNLCCFKQLDMTGPSRDEWRRAADLPSGEDQSSPSDARTRVKYNQFLVISSPVSFFRLFMSIIPLPHLNHVRCSYVMPCHVIIFLCSITDTRYPWHLLFYYSLISSAQVENNRALLIHLKSKVRRSLLS